MIPPDEKKCQAERGGAFTLGPGLMRCQSEPTTVVEEKGLGEEGFRGSMSLCDHCLKVFRERMNVFDYRFHNAEDWFSLQRSTKAVHAAVQILRETDDVVIKKYLAGRDLRKIALELQESFDEMLEQTRDLQTKVRRLEAPPPTGLPRTRAFGESE